MANFRSLAEIVIFVDDMERSLAFYRDELGLPLFSPPKLPGKFLQVGTQGGPGGGEGVPQQIVLVPRPTDTQRGSRDRREGSLHHIGLEVDRDEYEGPAGQRISLSSLLRRAPGSCGAPKFHPRSRGFETPHPRGLHFRCVDHPPDTSPDTTAPDSKRAGRLACRNELEEEARSQVCLPTPPRQSGDALRESEGRSRLAVLDLRHESPRDRRPSQLAIGSRYPDQVLNRVSF